MKIVELISKLVHLQMKYGNIETYVRGDSIGWTEDLDLEIDICEKDTALLIGAKEQIPDIT